MSSGASARPDRRDPATGGRPRRPPATSGGEEVDAMAKHQAGTSEERRGARVDASLAVEAIGLVKAFGTTRAVDGVDLAVPGGSVYGVLGPNGAGKTTTIRMLATLLRPDAGSARVLGHDIVTEADAVRGLMSLTGQL